MEPQIRYAQTKDGMSIAYWTLGEGVPFVHMPPDPFSHLQLEWQMVDVRGWYQRLAEKRRLVRYDGRGSGLSERRVPDYSLDAMVLDLEAVVDRLGLERFALWGFLDSGPAAIAYAARYPERVSHLILWCSIVRGADYSSLPAGQAEAAVRDTDRTIWSETAAHLLVGWSKGKEALELAALIRECATDEIVRAAQTAHGDGVRARRA